MSSTDLFVLVVFLLLNSGFSSTLSADESHGINSVLHSADSSVFEDNSASLEVRITHMVYT